ncbi:hypothetical protein chiPu_0017198 [Chiloscyllium punctatum]|uniref:Transmembrane protein 218 n=1 Tax=Chiloscyllium punctatum TaxID=137246 RepID=A0A401T7P3_CHIPU|nr:hypothetical protein [Chiloscyllium punctatum]
MYRSFLLVAVRSQPIGEVDVARCCCCSELLGWTSQVNFTMADVVMGVGPGVFILAVVWVLSLLICMLLSRSGGVISWLSIILVFFLALMITLILIFFPRAKETPESVTEDVVKACAAEAMSRK